MESISLRIARAAEALGALKTEPMLVAVSGGVDSMVLLRALAEAGFDVRAAHVNHGLRQTANGEATWLRRYLKESGVELLIAAPTVAETGNLQDSARSARYASLECLAVENGSSLIALGHTADDQAETLLMNLVRGSGLRGLAGMPPSRFLSSKSTVKLIRPMLGMSRSKIEEHATARGWEWLEDPTNASDAYLRNRIRHHVLPLLEAEGGPQTTARMAAAAADARAALAQGASAQLDALQLDDASGGAINLERFEQMEPAERRAVWIEALERWTPEAPRNRVLLDDLESLVWAQPGRRVVLGNATVWRDRDRLTFHASPDMVVNETLVVVGSGTATPFGTLQATIEGCADVLLTEHALEAALPASLADASVFLRTWRAGDRFADRAGKPPRNVSDMLSAARVPPSVRRRQLVVTANEEIVWLVGFSTVPLIRSASANICLRLRWEPIVGLGVPS